MGKNFQTICNKIQVRLISQPPFSDSVKGKSLTWVYTTIPPSDRKMFLFTLFSSKNVTNSHLTADIQTKGKLGNGNASLITSIHKHSKGPSVMVETYSRNYVVVMWAWRETLQRRGGLQSRSRSPAFLHNFFFHVELPLLSWPVNILPIFRAQPKCTLPWNHPGLISSCWVPKALFISLISHEGPSYSALSFVHMHIASLNSWGLRSVHQALSWTLTLIISIPHNYNPATQEVLAPFHRYGNWD